MLVNASIDGLANGMNKFYRLQNKRATYKFEYAIIIGVCNLVNVIFYISVLCMLNSAFKRLRRFAEESSSGSNKMTAGLHFLMIILLFLTTIVNDVILFFTFLTFAVRGDYSWWNLSIANIKDIETVRQMIRTVGTFLSLMILLYMFWQYTQIQDFIDGAPTVPRKSPTRTKSSFIQYQTRSGSETFLIEESSTSDSVEKKSTLEFIPSKIGVDDST